VWIWLPNRSRKKGFLLFRQKLELKSIYMLRESCSSGHTEHKKIGFAIFGFFYDFISNLQATRSKSESWKNLLALKPSELLKLHNHTLGSNTQALGDNPLHNCTLPRWSKLPAAR
jgi:hypothetical protein